MRGVYDHGPTVRLSVNALRLWVSGKNPLTLDEVKNHIEAIDLGLELGNEENRFLRRTDTPLPGVRQCPWCNGRKSDCVHCDGTGVVDVVTLRAAGSRDPHIENAILALGKVPSVVDGTDPKTAMIVARALDYLRAAGSRDDPRFAKALAVWEQHAQSEEEWANIRWLKGIYLGNPPDDTRQPEDAALNAAWDRLRDAFIAWHHKGVVPACNEWSEILMARDAYRAAAASQARRCPECGADLCCRYDASHSLRASSPDTAREP